MSNYKPEVLIVHRLADNPELLEVFEELVEFVRGISGRCTREGEDTQWGSCDKQTYKDQGPWCRACQARDLIKKIEGE